MEHSNEACTICKEGRAVVAQREGAWCGACALAMFSVDFDDVDAWSVLPMLAGQVDELKPSKAGVAGE